MAYNGSGTFNLASGNPVVTGTTISSTWANTTLSDIATGLSNVICKDGQSTPTANLPMGNYKFTGLAAGTSNGDSVRYEQVTSAVAITGGTINGTTIGATTPSTGAFTTLSASSTVTLSGGTANGVVYLDGSKAVTSGSALVFDGTNLGLGVTPSTWSVGKALQIGSTTAVWNDGSGSTYFGNNWNYNGGFTYLTTSYASNYLQYAGQHRWYTAPSGTAGNAISFTQAMTLDLSGNLGVGATSPTARIHSNASIKADQNVFSGDGYAFVFGSGTTSYWTGSSSTNYMAAFTNGSERMRIDSSGRIVSALAGTSTIAYTFGGQETISGIGLPASGTLAFYAGSSTERARIDSAGNVGIGTSSPSQKLHVYGSQLLAVPGSSVYTYYDSTANYFGRDASTGAMQFGVNGSERARIDSSGNFLVGTTNNNGVITSFVNSATGRAGFFMNTQASSLAYDALGVSKYDNNTTTSQVFVKFFINNNASGSGLITANGANAATFTSSSDARLKENIIALSSQLNNICALKPSEFDYKDGTGHQIGFIAQDMEQVYPDCVAEDADGMLMISGWSKTEARLVKAIQELKAELDELKSQIGAK